MRTISTCVLAFTAALALLLPAAEAVAGWPYAHANSANTGYVGVVTAPAGAGSVSVPNIGTFAPGAGPVIADDGTLYLGNQQGQLMAFRDDGAPLWTTRVADGESIVSSALISNGGIYVVGVTTTTAALYKFDSGGGIIWRAPFPQHGGKRIRTAAPNDLKIVPGGAIVMPALYERAPVYESRLIAFSGDGQLILDRQVSANTPSASADPFGTTFIDPAIKPQDLPLPMAAVYTSLAGRTTIVVADGMQSVVGYDVGGGGQFFVEAFRYSDDTRFYAMTSTPTIMVGVDGANNGFMANSAKGLLSATPTTPGAHYTAPNQHSADAPSFIGGHYAFLLVWKNELLVGQAGSTPRIQLAGRSIVSPAVSQTYFYVSSADALATFSVNGPMPSQVARFDWVGGGLNPPVIGPKGHVYAIASNILFIFPPPRKPTVFDGTSVLTPGKPAPGATTPIEPGIGTDFLTTNDPAPAPQPTSTLPPTQLFDPPLTGNGNRLFACLELDGDDCGKGDYREVSLAWCQSQGYAKVRKFDVDSRKVKAERLDGQLCTKSKCKVFDFIDCEM